ncbi:MAG: hypothetical protein Q8N83_15270 [Ignavibacteria bacterium]|nr:hypothetical protein [Ignavibacteria bacterium]
MILVSIYINEEKLFIEVKHKTVYQVEKVFLSKKNQTYRNALLFTHLFVSIIKLGLKELVEVFKTVKQQPKISEIPINYIEGK